MIFQSVQYENQAGEQADIFEQSSMQNHATTMQV